MREFVHKLRKTLFQLYPGKWGHDNLNYTFSFLTDPDKELIIMVLHNKYLRDSFDYQNETEIDKNGNLITINESHGFVINYIASTHKFFKEATSLMEINRFPQIKKERQKAKRLYDQL